MMTPRGGGGSFFTRNRCPLLARKYIQFSRAERGSGYPSLVLTVTHSCVPCGSANNLTSVVSSPTVPVSDLASASQEAVYDVPPRPIDIHLTRLDFATIAGGDSSDRT